MAQAPKGPAQYLARFSEKTIACNPYAMAKLGVDRAHCSIKIEEYMILCAPFQLGFRRSVFLASLSKEELIFFQRYVNGVVGLSIALNPNKRPEPMNFFVHCSLAAVGQMKGRENVGLFVLDYKSTPNELVNIMGRYLEGQATLERQFEDYGKTIIKMTPDAAKLMGYNMYASIMEPGHEPRRIQVYGLSSKAVQHMEAKGAPERKPGAAAAYQFFFRKFRVSVAGVITESTTLPQGLVRTYANLAMSPELVEIIDDYWKGQAGHTSKKSGNLTYSSV